MVDESGEKSDQLAHFSSQPVEMSCRSLNVCAEMKRFDRKRGRLSNSQHVSTYAGGSILMVKAQQRALAPKGRSGRLDNDCPSHPRLDRAHDWRAARHCEHFPGLTSAPGDCGLARRRRRAATDARSSGTSRRVRNIAEAVGRARPDAIRRRPGERACHSATITSSRARGGCGATFRTATATSALIDVLASTATTTAQPSVNLRHGV